MEKIHATTILAILHNGEVAIGGDGQATMGNYVAKSNV
ncbi:MAG TPA: HslU--HslV peptidase proteolytic subunit, partial [Cyclobacteriaceae bacterium]|nr:HslU--HslV peptidase proteolytic subunit [Cyclobacteriaceae bacterium]